MAFSKARRLSDFIAADGTVPATKFATGTITSAMIADTSITPTDLHTSLDLTGKTVTVANASTGDSDTTAANTAFVQQEIAALVDSSPGTLNTLNELAAALGDDANFSTTVTSSIATKLPLAGGTMTGALNMGSQNITNVANVISPSGSPLVLTGDSGANIELYGSGGSNNIYIDAAKVNYRGANGSGTGSIAIGTTVVIDGSRNLTNIGTISSGAITSSGNVVLDAAGHNYIELHSATANTRKWRFYNGQTWNPDALLIYDQDADATALTIETGKLGINRGAGSLSHTLDVGGNVAISGTEIITSARNLINIGTISSGRINPQEHIIFGSNTGYLQFPAANSTAWALYAGSGTNAPGTQGTGLSFHHWSGSAWNDEVSFDTGGGITLDGRLNNTYGNGNIAAPSTSDHGSGTRQVYYDSSATAWYARGIESNTLWDNTDQDWKLYRQGAVRLHWNESTDSFIINGVREYRKAVYLVNNVAYTFDIDVKSIGASGQVLEVFAGYTHYSTSYAAVIKQVWTQRSTAQSDVVIVNNTVSLSTSTGGAWSFTYVDADTVRLTKSAGTYGGGGYGYIAIRGTPA